MESLMFTLKYVSEFGQPRRRRLETVRNEMIEKITAYNFVKRMKRERQNHQNKKLF
jgi:hypothetical protein